MRRSAILLALALAAPLGAQSTRARDDSIAAALVRRLSRVDTVDRPVPVPTPVYVPTPYAVHDTVHDTTVVQRVDTLYLASAPTTPAPPVVVPPPKPPDMPPVTDPAGRQYVTNFVRFADALWTTMGAKWDGNYYDRAHIYFVAARRPELASRAAEFRDRGHAIAVDYRTKYLFHNRCNSSPHWAQLEGLADDYRDWRDSLGHPDSLSRKAVLCTADALANAFLKTPYTYLTPAGGEGRIAARLTLAQLLAWELADSVVAPPPPIVPGDTAWHYWPQRKAVYAKRLDQLIDLSIAWQDSTGAFPEIGITCGGQLDYMEALRSGVLADVYDRYRPDPRILTLIGRSLDYLRRTQWRADGSFNYASVTCTNGGLTASADLNGLFLFPFGWYARRSGDATYAQHAELILAGALRAFLSGTKQFNETYTTGLRWLELR
jgi:hypothetical protein